MKLASQVYDSIPPVRFGPVVEPKSMPDAFLIENPWKQNVINDVPFMTALTSDEGGLFTTSTCFAFSATEEIYNSLSLYNRS